MEGERKPYEFSDSERQSMLESGLWTEESIRRREAELEIMRNEGRIRKEMLGEDEEDMSKAA